MMSPPLASQPGEAAPEEVLCRPPREAWPLVRVLNATLMKMGRTGLLAQPRRGPQAGKSGDPARPIFTNTNPRPSRRDKPRGADDAEPPQARPRQAGSRGAEISRQGKTSRGSRDVSHDDQDQAGTSVRSVLVSSLVLRRQAQARSTNASSKGIHIGGTRPRPARRQDGGHHGAQGGVTTRAFCRRRPLLSG